MSRSPSRLQLSLAIMGFGVLVVGLAVYQHQSADPSGLPVNTGPLLETAPASVPAHITASLRLRGAVTGSTALVGLSVPASGCAAAAQRGAAAYLGTLAFLDVSLDEGAHHGTLALTPAPPGAPPPGLPRLPVHAVLTLPAGAGSVAYSGDGTIDVLADGGGSVSFTAAPTIASAGTPSTGTSPGFVDGELTWACVG